MLELVDYREIIHYATLRHEHRITRRDESCIYLTISVILHAATQRRRLAWEKRFW